VYEGIYELRNAGRYLYITSPQKTPHYTTIFRWVKSGLPKPHKKRLTDREIYINFQDLVSLRMIISLRIAGFSLKHIRGVHKYLQDLTGLKRPFALKDLWISGRDIFIEMEGFLSATKRGQLAMEFIKEWLKRIKRPDVGDLDLRFEQKGGKEIASSWIPEPQIMLDPLVQFGAPCLLDTRIPTASVWSMYKGGDSPTSIARSYNIPLYKVESGIKWEEEIANLKS
jgi:uncharacterized protein (DUF433 family)/DNA-binding transcriptional MerR regulator